MQVNKLDCYESLLDFIYDELVDHLLNKYGCVRDNYFNRVSYEQKLKSKVNIKQISKGNFTRSSEGLYCHHIDEKKEVSLSYPPTLWEKQLPYEYQEKERLVYCDAVEHVILHALISKEYVYSPGYNSLRCKVSHWYIEGLPLKEGDSDFWEFHCYEQSFLKSDEAISLLNFIEKKRLIKK
ncbi:hypothetical protein [Listeria seeligeri]|uniref:hypothetical protein n=1 Tax=Listeria seeligeri TaxID=1640 RepID=UPI0018884D1F|nr:hypothetical protein [Listeria seeligeri]MBF2564641.1 hypothetical protein [Listeria seeligeri]